MYMQCGFMQKVFLLVMWRSCGWDGGIYILFYVVYSWVQIGIGVNM